MSCHPADFLRVASVCWRMCWNGWPIARLRVRGLGRALIRRLLNAGFADVDSLREAEQETLRKAVNHRGAFGRLWAKLHEDDRPATPVAYPIAPPTILKAAEAVAEYEAAATAEPEPLLVVDLRQRRVTYRGHVIPTRPPHNLQRQPLLALAVLAQRPGEVVSMVDVAAEMFELGGLRKKPVGPDGKDLRYKLQRPFKRALAGTGLETEIAGLFETVPGAGIRLNLRGEAQVIAGK